jgi:hypothetical protein
MGRACNMAKNKAAPHSFVMDLKHNFMRRALNNTSPNISCFV